MPRLVILDRDGVINADPNGYISRVEDWSALPGSLEAIAALNQKGILVALASNQSGVGRGFFDEAMLMKITAHMKKCLAEKGGHFDHIAYCLHHPNEDCACRKPKPGLLEQISRALNCPLGPEVLFVGDSAKDILTAEAAGCTPILVRTGNGENTLKTLIKPPAVFDDLAAVVRALSAV